MPQDFRYYVDLVPMDIAPADIYLDSIEVARTVLPDFELRPGTIEDAMFQAFAYMTSLNVGTINRIPNSLFLGVIKMIGTQYKDGLRAEMSVKFIANSNSGATIPAGTLVQFSLTNEEFDVPYVYETLSALTIAANNEGDALPHGTVSCAAQLVGETVEVPVGSSLAILSYLPDVYSAEGAGSFVQGVEAESVIGFLDRGVANIASMAAGLVTANQLKNYVLSNYPNLITRTKVYDLTDPDGNCLVGDAEVNGKVAFFAYGPQRFLTNTEKTTILSDVENKTVAGLVIGIKDPVLLDVKITAAVSHFSEITSDEIVTQITDTLERAFTISGDSQWEEEKLKYNAVLQILLNSAYVRNVDSLTIAITETGSVTNAVKTGNNVTYTAANKLAVGDLVTVTGITPNTLNSTSRAVTARTLTSFTVENSGASGSYASGGAYSATFPNWGSASGSDFLFSKKGSIVNISRHKITITATAV